MMMQTLTPGPGTAILHPSDFDIYIAKYNADGNYIWAKNFGNGYYYNQGNAIAIDKAGALFVAGAFMNEIDFDPGPGVTKLTTAYKTSTDAFLAKYTTGTLPVLLMSFTGQPAGKYVQLNWQASSDAMFKRFGLQRSLDGLNFSTIGEINAGNATAGENKYTFLDVSPRPGINYYRLKEINKDGSFNYSKTISISFNTVIKASVFPNPTSAIINVSFDASAYQLIQLLDQHGKILASTRDSSGLVNFNLEHVAAGVYYIRLSGTKGVISRQVVRQ